MLRIWGRVNSSNTQKVLWLADEIGLAYERIDAGLEFGVNNTPEYRRMNPNGKIPTIDDAGFILWESNTIVRYLAAKHSDGKLSPAGLQARSAADKWLDWASSTLNRPVVVVFLNLIRTSAEKRDMAAVAQGIQEADAALKILDLALEARDFVCGAELTIGDIALGVLIYRWMNLDIARPSLPGVERYYKLLTGRPAYRKNIMIGLS